eukprot:s2367_g11.t1
MPVDIFTIDIVKGWTRATCVAWIMLAVSEMDVELDANQARLKPLEKFLDRAWNLSLSFRGSERQPPSVLQMALRFSVVIDRQANSTTGNTETRLKKVVQQFNDSPGLHVKHQVDAEKERTVLNLIIGTSKA